MKKRLVASFLSLCMILSMTVFASAAPADNQGSVGSENCSEISRSEYLQNYAEYHGVSYDEAIAIDMTENEKIWRDYAERNNIPVGRSIIYDGSSPIEGATLHYVTVYNTYHLRSVDVTYKAFGKIISDRQSRTFVKGSFGETRAAPSSGSFVLTDNTKVIVNDDDYVRLTLTLDGTLEIDEESSRGFGVDLEAIKFDFGVSSHGYYRREIHDSYTETLP